MESKCHIGKRCLYNFEKSASLNIRNHGLGYVIEHLETLGPVADCEVEEDCVDCEHWKFE